MALKCQKLLPEIELDETNGNTLWQDGIENKMTAVCVAFKTLN